jgi:hypothetical protein
MQCMMGVQCMVGVAGRARSLPEFARRNNIPPTAPVQHMGKFLLLSWNPSAYN